MNFFFCFDPFCDVVHRYLNSRLASKHNGRRLNLHVDLSAIQAKEFLLHQGNARVDRPLVFNTFAYPFMKVWVNKLHDVPAHQIL